MNRCKLWMLCGLAVLAASPAAAAEQDGRLWTTVNLIAPEWHDLQAGLLTQFRLRDDMGDLERFLLRPSVSYRANEHLRLTLGYDAHLLHGRGRTDEHRIWQQASTSTPFANLGIDHFLRLEQRFLRRTGKVGLQLRYLIAVATPELFGRFRGVVRDEVFFHLNEPTSAFDTGYGENRTFVGLQHPVADGWLGEVGYQAQFVERPGRDLVNHTLMLGLTVRM